MEGRKLLCEVRRTAIDIGHRIVRIDAQLRGCSRHQLHDAARTFWADSIAATPRFGPSYGSQEIGINPIGPSSIFERISDRSSIAGA